MKISLLNKTGVKVSIFLPNNIENYDDAEFEITYSKKLSDLMKLD